MADLANLDRELAGGLNSAENPSPRRVYTMLENHPDLMADLAHRLGLSQHLRFYDIYSLDDVDLRAMIPRPVYGMLATIPLTDAWKADRIREDHDKEVYSGFGPDEPVFWIRQTIPAGCGLIGLLHTVVNSLGRHPVRTDSPLARFLEDATSLPPDGRAQLLADNEVFHTANEAVAARCKTALPHTDTGRTGNHFVAFVKGGDGHLWELEGSRKGPLDRGMLAQDEDVFSERALDLGLGRIIKLNAGQRGALRFSCIALGPHVS